MEQIRKQIRSLELKARRGWYITNLMYYIVGGMATVFLLDFIGMGASELLYFNRAAIARGQVWRLVTFIFLPPSTSLLWVIFSLYFYWMIGNTLETQWGSFKFNLYYLLGIIGAVLGGLITGYGDNTYINLSLFLAFAALFPDFQMYLFFFLPIKMKWLALLDVLLYAYNFIMGGWDTKAAIVLSLLNVALFFGGDVVRLVRLEWGTLVRRWAFRRNYRR
ncbi:MAG: rhomboid family intramembrane serine protease [Oscillospiraceae bacterium]|jgi:membrane associated rhomboid family serine protease|nr:rhomboid family intramembrane serine protease [Oscillospiraceae bacterium]